MEQETRQEIFREGWFTIPEAEAVRPENLYHKEQEEARPRAEDDGAGEAGSGGDAAVPVLPPNLHVLARASLPGSAESGKAVGMNGGKDRDGDRKKNGVKQLLRITADDYYKLYLNGRFLAQGPAPAYPEHYYYNEIDLTDQLREDGNVLAVHLYYQGLVNRVWNSGDGRFGLACEIVLRGEDGEEAVETPEWRYQVSHAYFGDVTGYETQFLEDFDSRLWDDDWKEPEYDDRSWKPMEKTGWGGYRFEKQPVKMLQIYEMKPAELWRTGDGWFIDMGQEITGALELEALSSEDGARVVIRCGEELTEEGEVRHDMRCGCRYEETWTLRKGVNRLEPYDYKGFRYGQILCGEETTIRQIRAVVRHYPMDESLCTFRSDQKTVDQIFGLCKNGVKYGTQEGYLDCPTREKGQYLGDAVVTSRAQVWLTGSVEMLRKCVDQFARTAGICPGLMAVAPGSLMQEIADFSLMWPRLLLTDYEFTGDRAFLGRYYPTARGIIEHFRKYAREDGLLVQVADKWNLVDWPENLRDGYDFELSRPVVAPGCHNVINALYIGAVKMVSEIEEILGLPCSYDPEALKRAYIRTFYSEETGLFTDRPGGTHSALHSNIYPLYYGLCPEGTEERIADFLVEKGLCCGVMVSYFYLKALARIGRYKDVYHTIINESEHGWVNMLREGATACWEAWGKDQKWNTSLCHPWASAPIPVLIEDIAGVIPDPGTPGGFRFEPHIPEEMGDVEVRIPFRGKRYVVKRNSGRGKAENGDKGQIFVGE